MSADVAPAHPDYFENLYALSDDPWHIEQRWYERRKRTLLLAALPFESVDVLLEPGCGTGALSIMLAERCTRLIACDISVAAVTLARRRLRDCSNVELSCCDIPGHWPTPDVASVDCVVVSEFAYYLAPATLVDLGARIAACLKPTGCLVACHWKADFTQRTIDSRVAHEALGATLKTASLVHYEDDDFLLDVWSLDGSSVAVREGFA